MFKGSNVALVTPFKNNKLDEDTYIKLIHFHIQNGTNGLVPAGTTGESPTLSHLTPSTNKSAGWFKSSRIFLSLNLARL